LSLSSSGEDGDAELVAPPSAAAAAAAGEGTRMVGPGLRSVRGAPPVVDTDRDTLPADDSIAETDRGGRPDPPAVAAAEAAAAASDAILAASAASSSDAILAASDFVVLVLVVVVVVLIFSVLLPPVGEAPRVGVLTPPVPVVAVPATRLEVDEGVFEEGVLVVVLVVAGDDVPGSLRDESGVRLTVDNGAADDDGVLLPATAAAAAAMPRVGVRVGVLVGVVGVGCRFSVVVV
jgi:hypothetical protein